MYCTKCGLEVRDQDRFCCQCGCATARGAASVQPSERLSRPMQDAKLGGVCAGFARYMGVDVTLVRILWIVLTIWPLPLLGVIAYIVAWIVMPKDPVPAPSSQIQTA